MLPGSGTPLGGVPPTNAEPLSPFGVFWTCTAAKWPRVPQPAPQVLEKLKSAALRSGSDELVIE